MTNFPTFLYASTCTNTHMIHIYLPQVYQKIEKMKFESVEIVGAKISLIDSVLVRIKPRVLTVLKMRRSLACELFPAVACLRWRDQ